ncbi:MAG: tRNA-uridine aminocarboxypropyltransferase [Campylobacterota bacterium]|nr:tRNA-uridine aminocarboxypropyltransferase [Campylobacterota bacterium]
MANEIKNISRKICYDCYRPMTSCMCDYITPIKTQTRFIILMHPKEFRHTKNGTGHFTYLSLENSELYVGIDFSNHNKINAILDNPNNDCYVIYPSTKSINLNTCNLENYGKNRVLFLIDATWPCSKSMLLQSPNLDALQKVSFTHTKSSAFTFKKQPKSYCLSTIESTLCVLELLNKSHEEHISSYHLNNFLRPFEKMVEYQVNHNTITPKETNV